MTNNNKTDSNNTDFIMSLTSFNQGASNIQTSDSGHTKHAAIVNHTINSNGADSNALHTDCDKSDINHGASSTSNDSKTPQYSDKRIYLGQTLLFGEYAKHVIDGVDVTGISRIEYLADAVVIAKRYKLSVIDDYVYSDLLEMEYNMTL